MSGVAPPARGRLLDRQLAVVQRICSAALIVLGLLTMLGWWLDLEVPGWFHPREWGMRLNSGAGFLLGGIALTRLGWSPPPRASRLAAGLGLVLILAGCVTLLQYPAGRSFGLDEILLAGQAAHGAETNRMSGFAALAFVLLGAGIRAEATGASGRRAGFAQGALVAVALVGLFGLLANLHHASRLLAPLPDFGSLSSETSLGFLLAAPAGLLLRPDGVVSGLMFSRRDAGGTARRLAYLYVPLLVLFLAGVMVLEERSLVPPGEAAAVRDLSIFLALLFLGWRALARADRADAALRASLRETVAARDGLEAAVAARTAELRQISLQSLEARRAAEESRALLDAVLQRSPSGIIVKRWNGEYMLANHVFGEITGRDPATIPGLRDGDLFPPGIAEVALASDAMIRERGIPSIREVTMARADGQVRTHLVTKDQVRLASGERVICGIATDITERVQAEAALRESEAALRLTLDNAQVGLWDWQIETGALKLDRNWNQILGQDPTEALPTHVDAWRATLHPEDSPEVYAALDRHLQNPAFLYDVTYRARHRQKGQIWVNSRGRVVECGHDGHPIRMMGTVTDVTLRRMAELATARLAEDLETLLHVTSHDLREPLRSIDSFARLIRERYGTGLDPKGADYLDRVIRAAGRMQGLVDDVLALSRARRTEVHLDAVDSRGMLEEVCGRLEHRIRETGARIEVPAGLPILYADRTLAVQALYNLVGNALKFHPPGRAPEVTVLPWREPGGIGVVVADRGIGVAEAQRERVFQLFQRGVGREFEGSGAGLAIVRQVAERHGGRAWCRPRDGGGSEFIVTFGVPGSAA